MEFGTVFHVSAGKCLYEHFLCEQSGDYSWQREAGHIEREREGTAGGLWVQMKERQKERKMLLRREKKTGGGCCVVYDNLKLFDGINKKKNLMQESSLGPVTDYSSRFACGSYYIIYSLWWDFPPLLVFLTTPLYLLYRVPALAGFSFNLRRRCLSHTWFFGDFIIFLSLSGTNSS